MAKTTTTDKMISRTYENVHDNFFAMLDAQNNNIELALVHLHAIDVMLDNLRNALLWLSDIGELSESNFDFEFERVNKNIQDFEEIRNRMSK